ncbi:MAG: hypothetical protein R3B47_20930 [Bacteroidia bacterium]
MTDTYLYKENEKLVEQLSAKGITDQAVLDAIMTIPRHIFLDTALHHEAVDRALPHCRRANHLQPFTVAFMTEPFN